MTNLAKLPEKFFDVLKQEGVVSIISWGIDDPHVVNTWNSYLVVTDDGRILIPAYGFKKTEKNILVNNKVKLALGAKEVIGFKDYQGTGFVIDGTAKYLSEGSDFDTMKDKFSFLTRVFEVSITNCKQKI